LNSLITNVMKKMLYLLLFVMGTATVQAQATASKTEVLSLRETSFNFGKIPQGRPVTHVFEVTNTGKEPLVLENVQASCGCTTPEWSREAIAPGATQRITVGYNAASEGVFEKSITIFYQKGQMKMITIRGEVWRTPDQPAPYNSAITILKQQNR
jgi:Protein of unknown function (DUF1573)